MIKVHIKTPICDQELGVAFERYNNGRLAIKLWGKDEPFYVATVNIPGAPVVEGCVLLKGWSENEGLPEAMEVAGLVKLTGRTVETDFVSAQEAKLLCAIPEGV